MKFRIYQFGSFLFYLFTFFLLFIETFKYPGFFKAHFNFEVNYLILIYFALILLIRLGFYLFSINKKPSLTDKRINHFNQQYLIIHSIIIFPILALINILMYLAEKFIYCNFSFEHFHLHPDQFVFLVFFHALVIIAYLNKAIILKYREMATFYLSLLIIAIFTILRFRSKFVFFYLLREDNLIETLTAIFNFLAGIMTLKIFFNIKKLKTSLKIKTFLQISFLCLSLAFLFVAGEELSWGQRLFNLITPESISSWNLQKEINLHNHEFIFFKIVYPAYQIVGLYAGLMWILKFIAKKRIAYLLAHKRILLTKAKIYHSWLDLLIPNWYLMFYFLIIAFYVELRHYYGYWLYTEFSESGEAMMALGFFLLMLEHNHQLKKYQF